MPSTAPLLRVRDAVITYAGQDDPVIHGVGFDVRPGEVVLLLGPSGSGKSTLTLALNGLIPHSVEAGLGGTIEVLGRSTADTPVAGLATDVSMVFQDPDAQLVTGTVLDEVAFAPENLLLPVDEVLARAEAALRRMELWERRHENPDLLSGGGRQRLAIACALATGSRLLVLDEPTANLDRTGTAEVYAALRDLVADGDRAVVLVEHDVDAALAIATRAIVLDREGRVAVDGPISTVFQDHADDLRALGVWLPAATDLALRLRDRGIAVAPLPLTPAELARTLDREPVREPSGPAAADDAAGAPSSAGLGDAEPAIRVRDLTVARHRTTILHGIDLDVAAGSVTAVVGANGAGKTTLVQAIAGVVPPPRGRIDVAGIDPGRASPRELTSRIGFVFQNPEHQFIAGTVFDELAHGLRLRRAPAAEIRERVEEMLHRFGLEHRADAHPFLLSGGEKRRLSVGTALISRPQVLVLDEPTFGQDRARTDELLAIVHDLRRDGTTVLLVTHDASLVAAHTTHAVRVGEGRILAAGRTADLLRDGTLPVPAAVAAVPPALRPLLGPGNATGAVR